MTTSILIGNRSINIDGVRFAKYDLRIDTRVTLPGGHVLEPGKEYFSSEEIDAMRHQDLLPKGWRIPSVADWNQAVANLGYNFENLRSLLGLGLFGYINPANMDNYYNVFPSCYDSDTLYEVASAYGKRGFYLTTNSEGIYDGVMDKMHYFPEVIEFYSLGPGLFLYRPGAHNPNLTFGHQNEYGYRVRCIIE